MKAFWPIGLYKIQHVAITPERGSEAPSDSWEAFYFKKIIFFREERKEDNERGVGTCKCKW